MVSLKKAAAIATAEVLQPILLRNTAIWLIPIAEADQGHSVNDNRHCVRVRTGLRHHKERHIQRSTLATQEEY